ncbi:MAG TPA: DUF190 domain-containing protein [Acetobacteraceae bacterium]|nr:DUF190 domain-containing protein [Acetobacteraceae bacterium]
MRVPKEAVLLRVFVTESDRIRGQCVHEVVVRKALEIGMKGATVLPAPAGYGHSRRLRSELNIDAGPHLPMVVEIVDTEDRIERFLPEIDGIIETGLVTLEKLRAIFLQAERRAENGPATPAPIVLRGEGLDMEVPHEAALLRIFTSVSDRWGTGSLYLAIVEKARECGLAGATVLRGPLGFGHAGRLHRSHLFPVTQDLPVVIEIVDSEERIEAFLPIVDTMMESGLVTIERARVIRYGRHRLGFLSRLRRQLGMGTAPSVAP